MHSSKKGTAPRCCWTRWKRPCMRRDSVRSRTPAFPSATAPEPAPRPPVASIQREFLSIISSGSATSMTGQEHDPSQRPKIRELIERRNQLNQQIRQLYEQVREIDQEIAKTRLTAHKRSKNEMA